MSSADHAALCVKEQVWYRYKKHCTELGRRAPMRCFNCLKPGHAASGFPAPPLCPYCREEHHTHTCKHKGLRPPKCTTCARKKREQSPHLTVKHIFESHPYDLAHSPFDPKCAVRITASLETLPPSMVPIIIASEDSTITLNHV